MDSMPGRKKRLIVHASQLVPFDRPYIEPEDIGFSPETEPDPEDPMPQPGDRAARARKRRAVAVNNAWEIAKRL
jgi:hypothetical protein